MRKSALLLLSFFMILCICACNPKTVDMRLAEGSVQITAENLPKIAVTELNINLAVNLVSATLGCDKEAALSYITVFKTPDECYNLLAQGECDIVLAHEPSEKAVAYFQELGFDYISTCIAKDALIFTVSEQNEVADLSTEQLTSIYSAQTLNWNEYGMHDGEIETFKASNDSAATNAFKKYINVDYDKINVPKRYIKVEDREYFAELEYNNGINSVTFALYSDLQRQSTDRFGLRKYLSISGSKPEASAIQSGAYPLCVDILLTTTSNLAEDSVLKVYRDWILSTQGTAIIGGSGVILPIRE